MKLHLDNNIVEGTPEELVKYKELMEEKQYTFQGLLGSLKIDKSSIGSTESSTEDEAEEVYNDVYDKGAFYIVTDEASESLLPVGAILQHQYGIIFEDSKDVRYIISNPSYVEREHVNGDVIKKERFELAKQLGIRLKTTTDFAVEAKGKYFKVTEEHADFEVGDIVTIAKDDSDNQPQCKDKYGNFSYVFLRYMELLEDDEAVSASTELQVGDRVKVVKSVIGAVGEATVTAVLENGYVELEGKNENGHYSTSWRNHVSNIEKIEDAPMGYTFWYLDGVTFNKFAVVKATLDGDFEDSTGTIYTHQAVSGLIKPLDREDARKKFEKAENYECLLKYYPTADVFAWK